MGNRPAQPDWVVNSERTVKGVEEGLKVSQDLDLPDWIKQNDKNAYEMAWKKYSGESKAYEKLNKNGYIVVDTMVKLPFAESAGMHLSKFFTALRDEGKILANRCPSCRRVIFPPRVLCGYCRIRIPYDDEKSWLEVSDKGEIISYSIVSEREVDRATGLIQGETYPCAFIRLDGGDEWTIAAHFLEERNEAKIKDGMRVQAIWKPKEERRARMTDILYFRAIDE